MRGYFFDRYTEAGYELDADWFVFDLQPGPVSIEVDEIGSDIYAYADLKDPDGGRVPDTQGLSVSSIGRPHTPALNGSATVAKAGSHRLEIKFYAREEAGFRESWKKPYRLVVTQP